MNNVKKCITLLTAIACLALVVSGCGETTTVTTTITAVINPTTTITLPPGTDIPFENLVSVGENVGGDYKGITAVLQIVTNVQPPSPIELDWLTPGIKNVVLSVDYSKYFLIVAFNGYRGSIGNNMEIKRIWQNNNSVYVLARIDDGAATVLPLNSSQYRIAKIDRQQLLSYGDITFKLFDESGKERATIVQEVRK